MRVLPALQPPAFMSDAGESVRKAWAAMSASVAGYLPTELPPLPRLPALTLPSFRLPQRPTIPPPLGRFFSSLSVLIFAPGQIHGMAIYYQVATGDLKGAAADGPRVEFLDVAAVPWSSGPVVSVQPDSAAAPAHAAVTRARCVSDWLPAVPLSMDLFLTAVGPPAVPEFVEVTTALPCVDLDRTHWVDLAAQGMRVRGQRPPPGGADIPA